MKNLLAVLFALAALAFASEAQAGGRALKAVVVNDGFGPRVVFVEDVGVRFVGAPAVAVNVGGGVRVRGAAPQVNVNVRRGVFPLFRRNDVNVFVR